MSAEVDLFGEAIIQEPAKPKAVKAVSVQPPATASSEVVIRRPYTVNRLSKTVTMIINDDCAHLLK